MKRYQDVEIKVEGEDDATVEDSTTEPEEVQEAK